MRRAASGSSGLFSIGVLSLTVLAAPRRASVHTSGFIACYLAASSSATCACRTARR